MRVPLVKETLISWEQVTGAIEDDTISDVSTIRAAGLATEHSRISQVA